LSFFSTPSRTFFAAGLLAFDMFFVLSGFLITSLLCNEFVTTNEISFRHFYLRRASRLLPALLVVVAVFLAVKGRSGVTDASAALFYYMNILCATDPSIIPSAIGHTWSLATEEQFYFVWPLLFLWSARRFGVRKAGALALAMAIVSASLRIALTVKGVAPARVYYAPDTHCDGIFLGCFMALRPINHPRLAALWPLPMLLIIALAFFGNWPSRTMAIVGFAVANISAAWIIVALSARKWLATIFSFQLPVFLGKISYGMYLWHYFLFVSLKPLVPLFPLKLALFPLTVAVSSVSYFLIERPIHDYYRKKYSVKAFA
jgi:peptidoglycan/LPS O-acetylase OafA/YrhL